MFKATMTSSHCKASSREVTGTEWKTSSRRKVFQDGKQSIQNSASFCSFMRSPFCSSFMPFRPLDSTFLERERSLLLLFLFLRVKATCYVQTTHLAIVDTEMRK